MRAGRTLESVLPLRNRLANHYSKRDSPSLSGGKVVEETAAIRLVNRALNLSWEKKSFIYAATQCLSEEAACEVLDVEKEMAPEVRRGLLKKIAGDIKDKKLLPCHVKLVDGMMQVFPALPAKRRAGCAFCLSMLFDTLPLEHRIRILHFFLQSALITIRRRGYRKARSMWDESYHPILEEAWKRHCDPECALVITEHFGYDFLLQEFDKIWDALAEPWQAAKLFLRIAEQNKAKLSKLAEVDEISFAYVRAKLSLPFEEDEAVMIFERNVTDSRVGLLIWAFGKMGLIGALRRVIEHSDEYERKYFEARFGKTQRYTPVMVQKEG